MNHINVMQLLCDIAPQNDWTHSQQVWISEYIFMDTLADMICIDVTSTLYSIASQNDWTRN